MTEKTARKYRDSDPLPSQARPAYLADPGGPVPGRLARTRRALRLNPGLQAKTLFVDLQRRFPGRFPDVQLRTLQRRIKTVARSRRAAQGGVLRPGPPARPARAPATSPTWPTCGVTISGAAVRPPDLSLRADLLQLGGRHGLLLRELREPQRGAAERPVGTGRRAPAAPHRSPDRGGPRRARRAGCSPSATRRCCAHYGLEGQAIQPGQANENGDVEQSHHRFKQAVDQALMLRGQPRLRQPRRLSGVPRRAVRPAATPAGRSGWPRSWPCCGRCRRGRLETARRLKVRVGPGQHDPRRGQHLLGAQPADRRAGRGPRRRRAPRGLVRARSRWSSCRGCGAGASIASSTATSSTGWSASPGRSRSTATATSCSRPAGSGMAYDVLRRAAARRARPRSTWRSCRLAASESEAAWTRRCGCCSAAGRPLERRRGRSECAAQAATSRRR